VQITDAGVSPPLNDMIADLTGAVEAHAAVEGDAVTGVDYNFRAFTTANVKESELIIGMPNDDPNPGDPVITTYVYNTQRHTWSTWFDAEQLTHMAYDPATSFLMAALDAGNDVLQERDPVDDPYAFADRSYSAEINDIDENVVTIDPGSGWTPAVGDLVTDSISTAFVSAVTSATVFELDDATGFSVGNVAAEQAFESEVAWLPHTGPGGSAFKRYQGCVLHWDDTRGMSTWTVGISGSLESTEQEAIDAIDYQDAGQQRADTRVLLQRSVANQPQLYVSARVKQAASRWRLSGMALDFILGSGRVRR
jgi:hypothetical protein